MTFDYQIQFADNREFTAATDELLSKLNVKAWLVGQSLGEVVAKIIAKNHPELVKLYIYADTLSGFITGMNLPSIHIQHHNDITLMVRTVHKLFRAGCSFFYSIFPSSPPGLPIKFPEMPPIPVLFSARTDPVRMEMVQDGRWGENQTLDGGVLFFFVHPAVHCYKQILSTASSAISKKKACCFLPHTVMVIASKWRF